LIKSTCGFEQAFEIGFEFRSCRKQAGAFDCAASVL
jgi:hypothetical protein